MKRKICILGLALVLLCAASCADGSRNSDNQTSSAGTAEQTTTAAQESRTDTETELPEEAKNAVLAYIKSDSYESLADSILPTSAAQEAKNGKTIVGNYYFGLGPGSTCEDIQILECSRLSKDQAERTGSFWSTGFSMQGFSSEFTAEDGYEAVVSAVCSVESEDPSAGMLSFKVTARLDVLKIKDDRWIVVPTADETTNTMEPIE